jgi:hypothetical protein
LRRGGKDEPSTWREGRSKEGALPAMRSAREAIRSELEEEGIHCFMNDTHTIEALLHVFSYQIFIWILIMG